ncbi:MAG: BrnA antitoxin family protein [Fibrobacter sp.]|nr:BrnA antitoxin family protein [Fibrobacter sp.]
MRRKFKSINIPVDEEEKNWMESFENADVQIVASGSKMDDVLNSAIDAIKDRQRKMYSFRLPIAVMDKIKLKAKKAGIPYQSLVCSALTELSK